MNRQSLLGRIGKAPESSNGVTKFTLATSEKWTNKEGQKQERTDWHNIVAFGRTGETLQKYVNKGDQLYLEGKTRHNEYEDKDGNKRRYTSVEVSSFEFISSPKKSAEPVSESISHENLPF